MADDGAGPVSDGDIDAYARDGVVWLKGVFAPHWIERLAEAFERAKASPGPEAVDHAPEEGAGRFVTDLFLWRRDPEVRRFLFESPAGAIAARLMRAEAATLFFDTMWIKEPGVRKPTAWHQDQPYYPVDGDQLAVVWLPLDPVPEEVALAFVRGSHRWHRWFEPTRTTDGTRFAKATSYEPVPDIDHAPPDTYDVIRKRMDPGDCVVFHGLTLHGAPGNPQKHRRRRALSIVCLGDDAIASRRPSTRPRLADTGFTPGQPFRGPHFPRLWPRENREGDQP
ncbi:MAG: phytanoyl-CoA dioxygenase family protein [Alphaproteobacteria bacterium]